MASQISLGYHNLLETKQHNRAQEAEAIRANNLLDTRTKEIASLDRESRERVADKDRTSREGISRLDRDSRFLIAERDRGSREFINERQLANQRSISALDRTSRESIARLDRESRERINDLQLQNNLDRIQKQFENNMLGSINVGLLSGNPWATMAAANVAPAVLATYQETDQEQRDSAAERLNQWLGIMDLYAANQALNQGANTLGSLIGGVGSGIRGMSPNYSSSNYYTYSPSYTPQYSPRAYWGDSYHY